MVRSGLLERETGVTLDPAQAHVFLCGNPAMIGVSRAGHKSTAEPGSLLDLLQSRGFRPANTANRGTVHFERYW